MVGFSVEFHAFWTVTHRFRRTLNYHDDVLKEKFKNLVYVVSRIRVTPLVTYAFICSNGAINRAKLEKNEPTMTYEAFVSELDIGDSFTTLLIDMLVKVSLYLW